MSTRNSKNNGNPNPPYDTYTEMRFNGRGKIVQEKVDAHSVVKSCLTFDGKLTGNSNVFVSWANNAKYTINFWIKTTQKTKGVLICDMEHETFITNGVMIGLSDGGQLEVAFNSATSRIYPVNISDGQWHMISVVASNTQVSILVDAILLGTQNVPVANKRYTTNYQVYFMGHPLGKTVKGSISRIGFYNTPLGYENIVEMSKGDVEHRIYGTILASNMPFETEVRFYNFRTGQYINSAYSSKDNGQFIYRNYTAEAVHLLVVNNNHKYGTIQVMGPLNPSSVPI